MVEFCEQLRRAREAKGMTQQSLAEQLHVTRQSVSRWEWGDWYPDLLTTKKISQILEVSLDDLLSGKEITISIAAFLWTGAYCKRNIVAQKNGSTCCFAKYVCWDCCMPFRKKKKGSYEQGYYDVRRMWFWKDYLRQEKRTGRIYPTFH